MNFEGLRELLDLLPVLIAFADKEGSIGWANSTFCELFSLPKDGAQRASIGTLLPHSREDFPGLIREVVETGIAKTGIEETVSPADAKTVTLKIDILPCTGKKEDPGWVILFALDITGQAEMDRLKKDAYEQIDKNIEQFAILGDHIRNPVAVIIGLCDLIQDREAAEKILAQALEIDRIVDQIDKGWIDSEKVRTIIKKYYDVGVSGTHELVARAIHEEYIVQQEKTGMNILTNPSMRPWGELSRSLQEANLRQADDIWRKLHEIHCAIGLAVETKPAPFAFTSDEIELLAMHEHERWMNEKIKRGWSYGPVVDIMERTNNCLVPWIQLPEMEREKDRNAVRTLPQILARVRLKIIRF